MRPNSRPPPPSSRVAAEQFYPGAWSFGLQVAGYETDFQGIHYVNVSRPLTTKVGFSGRVDTSGILNDLDGSLAGVPGGSIAPFARHFLNNPDCWGMHDTIGEGQTPKSYSTSQFDYVNAKMSWVTPDFHKYDFEYVVCKRRIRRVNLDRSKGFASAFVNFNYNYQYPFIAVIDVTDYSPGTSTEGVWANPHYMMMGGLQSCVDQAPDPNYMFLGNVGRKYLMLIRDQNGVPVTGTFDIAVSKMAPGEVGWSQCNISMGASLRMRWHHPTRRSSSTGA